MNTDSLSTSMSLESSLCSLSDSDSEKNYDFDIEKLRLRQRNNENGKLSPSVLSESKEACSRIYDALYSGYGTFSIHSPLNQVALSIFWLFFWPWIHLNGEIPINSITVFITTLATVYDGAFSVSCYLVAGITALISLYYGHKWYEQKMRWYNSKHDVDLSKDEVDEIDVSTFRSESSGLTINKLGTTAGDGIGFVYCFFMINLLVLAQLSCAMPSFLWFPFLYWPGAYKINTPEKVSESLEGLCLDYDPWEKEYRKPLCLSEKKWNALSGGAISSKSDEDVATVLKGLEYVQHKSGGFLLNTMCRDCVEKIPSFRSNVENLKVFFPTFSVVIFENDSIDGSREAFKAWAREAEGYTVDLVECEEAVDCKFKTRHRYDYQEGVDFEYTSGIGQMAEFRNRIMDYALNKTDYKDYSHVMVYDMDLLVSLSPLGIIHSIGAMPDNPIAARGRQPFPGSFGTIVFPYDMLAYEPFPTNQNKRLRQMQKMVCGLSEPGHRWRNMCKALSPFQMMMNLADERKDETFVKVTSAFNGGAIYPFDQIRRSHPRYYRGDDGQICEHISFAKGMEQPMYMNRKWKFNIYPSGSGATGDELIRQGNIVTTTPSISVPLVIQRTMFLLPFITAVNRITIFLIYPMFFRNFFVCLQAYRFILMFITAKIISNFNGKPRRKRTSSVDV